MFQWHCSVAENAANIKSHVTCVAIGGLEMQPCLPRWTRRCKRGQAKTRCQRPAVHQRDDYILAERVAYPCLSVILQGTFSLRVINLLRAFFGEMRREHTRFSPLSMLQALEGHVPFHDGYFKVWQHSCTRGDCLFKTYRRMLPERSPSTCCMVSHCQCPCGWQAHVGSLVNGFCRVQPCKSITLDMARLQTNIFGKGISLWSS